jgi:hypothetical protein
LLNIQEWFYGKTKMVPIKANQITHNIPSLFDLTKPTMPRSFNVLKGINRGNILVDDLTNPTRAVVREATSGTLYFGGWLDAPLLESQVLHFRQSGEVGIGCWLDDPLNFVKDRWINNDGSKN